MFAFMNPWGAGEALLLGEPAEAEPMKEELGPACAAAPEEAWVQGTYCNTPQGILTSCAWFGPAAAVGL